MALEKDLTVEGQTRRGNFLKKLEVKDKVNSKNPFGRSADQGTNNEAQNGSVMFSNGQVIVRNPQGLGKFPTISQGTKVEVLINGEKITGIAFVKEGDHIEVQVVNTEPSFSLNLKISKDRMKASLFMRKKLGKRYEIEDIPPSLKICISAKCGQEIWPEVELQQVLNLLHENKVIFGIQEDAIQEAVAFQKKEISIVVAVGQEPTGVQDSQIVYTYKKQVANQDSRFQSGNVLLLSVAIDEILAVKQPSVPGYPGTDVTGETVPPRQPKDEPILIKGGVRLINDETVAVATISGKPVLEGSFRKYLSVDPVYVVNGDVGINTGNISFIGNILITGSVLDGFSVDAGGSIEVWENAMHATLYANREVTIRKNAISTRIQAGGLSVNYMQILQMLRILQSRLESMFNAATILKSQPFFSTADLKAKGEGQLVQLLIDFKYKDIPKIVTAFVQTLCEANKVLDPLISEVATDLKDKLCNLGPLRIKEQVEVEMLIANVQKAVATVESLISTKVNITVNYVQNSAIRTTGDIAVMGPGSIASELEAGGSILILSGKVRGGRLIARDKIKIGEIGSPTGDSGVNIQLLDNCCLEAKFVHSGIKLEHGTERLLIQEHYRDLRAWVNESGQLKLEGVTKQLERGSHGNDA
ncbi:MAG TPA: FapA family protein [Desulfosporosinus sp.]|nr:FapA family protein [Desulfosporosinus sp.]